MATINYSAIPQPNTTFNQPRQKQWAVYHNAPYWTLKLLTHSYIEAQNKVKEIMNDGGIFTSIDRVMLCEVVPIDIAITPNV